jgi:hypothetical protein
MGLIRLPVRVNILYKLLNPRGMPGYKATERVDSTCGMKFDLL